VIAKLDRQNKALSKLVRRLKEKVQEMSALAEVHATGVARGSNVQSRPHAGMMLALLRARSHTSSRAMAATSSLMFGPHACASKCMDMSRTSLVKWEIEAGHWHCCCISL